MSNTTQSNDDWFVRIASNASDTVSDSSTGDMIFSTYNGPPTRAFLVGFATTSSNIAQQHSVLRVDSNTGLSVVGAGVFSSFVTSSKGFYGPSFSNVGGNTYVSTLELGTLVLHQRPLRVRVQQRQRCHVQLHSVERERTICARFQ